MFSFFFVLGAPSEVNADRVKCKLPSLLLDGVTDNKKGWRAFMRSRWRHEQFLKRPPKKFNTLTNNIIED